MAYRVEIDTCSRCGGSGWEETAESNDQYDRTRQQYDLCRHCGGEGVVIIEIED